MRCVKKPRDASCRIDRAHLQFEPLARIGHVIGGERSELEFEGAGIGHDIERGACGRCDWLATPQSGQRPVRRVRCSLSIFPVSDNLLALATR